MARRVADPEPDLGAAPEQETDPLRILLVDDRPENLRALEAVLAPLAHPLVSVGSGSEALRLLLEQEFAVILLDVRMPGLDGLETARLIKSRERSRDIPIIFMTAAQDDVGDIIRGYEIGAVDYVLKPFDADLLRSKVSIFVELQERRRALQQSEAFLRGAFDYAPIGKTLLAADLRIVRANPAFARLLEYEQQALEGLSVVDLCHPDDRDALTDALHRVAAGDPGQAAPDAGGVDLRLRTRVGSDVWVGLVGSAIAQGEVQDALLLAQWIDISVRRRAEQARAELLLEQSARTQAEAVAERLRKLQALTDALEPLGLDPLLAELAVRIAELFQADSSEVSVGPEGEQRTVCARGSRVVSDGDGAARDGADSRWLTAPMQIERHGVGTVAIHRASSQPFTSAEQSLLHEVADRAALAIRQAELYEEEHRIADALQRGLLPQSLPSVEGVEIAAHYQAGGTAAEEVGGDWYDAFALPGGRLGIVVGDVAGRGIPAATTMGQMRSVTRAYAVAEQQRRPPGTVLTYLNRYQLTLDVHHLFTVVYAVIDAGARTVSWANAGHLPPLVLRGREPARYLSGGSYPIGVEDVEYETHVESLEPGTGLLLYTDGLVERRTESLDVGFERLIQAAKDGPPAPDACLRHLLNQMLEAAGHLRDDVTLVLARLASKAPG